MADFASHIQKLQRFTGDGLTSTLSEIEYNICGHDRANCIALNTHLEISDDLLHAAAEIKRVTGQINVVIHALGILHVLPRILHPQEKINYVSLGAGNTGRKFDLETDRRIAEFKFISWRGGAEAIRQNSLFKDFFLLAEEETSKERYLYVLDLRHPLKFLRGSRSLASVTSRMPLLAEGLEQKYGSELKTAGDYYRLKKDDVQLVDMAPLLPRTLIEATSESE